MSSPFVAQLLLVPYNFAPKGWAICAGQLMPISQNTALFSLIATFYGGDGKSNFALPNMQGNAAMGMGQGPGTSDYFIGRSSGSNSVTLQLWEMPAHGHAAKGVSQNADQSSPNTFSLADAANVYATGTPNAPMSNSSGGVAGGGGPHNNMMPFLGLNWVIALQGVFPVRS